VAFRKLVVGYEFQIGPATLLMTLFKTRIYGAPATIAAKAGEKSLGESVFPTTLKVSSHQSVAMTQGPMNSFRGGL
jgi:hypothetical protein